MKKLIIATSMIAVYGIANIAAAATSEGVAQQGQVTQKGDVTVFAVPQKSSADDSGIDYKNAVPMPLPQAKGPVPTPWDNVRSTVERVGEPGFEAGKPGPSTSNSGNSSSSVVEPSSATSSAIDGVTPQEYGTGNIPYTTSRVDLSTNKESKVYPYRAAGKLYFKDGTSTYMCSASLIKRGVAVTAAHCVSAFGENRFYTNFQFIPALSGATKPYGTWAAKKVYVMTSYYNGSDTCAEDAEGVVCQNDVAVIALTPQSRAYPGTKTGWFGYGWNGYGFTSANLAQINQLGYPYSHDSGLMMQRTDSLGYVVSDYANNTLWGSRQTGGSSGGPELVNLGIDASRDSSAPLGSEADYNIVVGVTSWGYTDSSVKTQGASPFTSTNIKTLVTTACQAYPAACK